MNSKEALEELQCVLVSNQATKRYSDIFEENLLRPIEKDLEVLNILKKHIYSSDSSISIILDDLRNYDDFRKVKEWLENE